ncbi:hypothetical protein WJX74_010112 [Apatococcus lobatus]|uniref:Uncharacterized protein n=1 Tax=Apatococcus lobatus TaxID=904363 RepID=A0AAW1QU77_9CHLO
METNYSQHSHGQARANQAAQPLLQAAGRDIASAQRGTEGPICVGDIGCSVGNNSVAELAIVLRCLDEQGCADREVSITHVDQPGNHWDQLFTALASAPNGYRTVRVRGRRGPIFSYAMAQDMYQQCFPSAYMHIVYSGKSSKTSWEGLIGESLTCCRCWKAWDKCITMHWGSAAVNAPDHLIAQFSADPKAKQAAQQQGHSDLLRWLQLRAKELKPGGHLVVTAIGTQDEASAGSLQQGYDIATAAWSRLVADGRITQQEFASTCFPTYFWMLDACIEVIREEMLDTFDILRSSSGRASKTSSSRDSLSAEEVSEAAAAGMLAVLGPGLRQALAERSVADQDKILHVFRQELSDHCLAAHFEFFTNYILLALRRR